jgi:hypothetical protein
MYKENDAGTRYGQSRERTPRRPAEAQAIRARTMAITLVNLSIFYMWMQKESREVAVRWWRDDVTKFRATYG